MALPGPGGFTPIFVLIVLAGYAYGARFGFLTGALTLAVSAIVTGGVGPWLPYQMFAAGWVGLTPAARCPATGGRADHRPARHRGGRSWPWRRSVRCGLRLRLPADDLGLVLLDAGAIGAAPGSDPLLRYLVYYVATSLVWDCFGAAGTFVLLLATGGPLLVALGRFQWRFRFRSKDRRPTFRPRRRQWGRAPDRDERRVPDWLTSADLPPEAVAGPPIHARAWLAWALAVAALASITRNPVLLGGAARWRWRWCAPPCRRWRTAPRCRWAGWWR